MAGSQWQIDQIWKPRLLMKASEIYNRVFFKKEEVKSNYTPKTLRDPWRALYQSKSSAEMAYPLAPDHDAAELAEAAQTPQLLLLRAGRDQSYNAHRSILGGRTEACP